MAPIRFLISVAAADVNVIARMFKGLMPCTHLADNGKHKQKIEQKKYKYIISKQINSETKKEGQENVLPHKAAPKLAQPLLMSGIINKNTIQFDILKGKIKC
jgi:hypothetical protein